MPVATAPPARQPKQAAPTAPPQPPAPSRTPDAPTAPTAPPATGGARGVVLHNISWSLYESLLEAVGNGWPHMVYDDGTLEFKMPYAPHEITSWFVDHFITAYCEELGISFVAAATTTQRRESKRGGLEPDQAYYLQTYEAAKRITEMEPGTYPPPDLALEIDLASTSVNKEDVYARLGVPELWRWPDDRFVVLALAGDTYRERETSPALPGFPLDRLTAAILAFPDTPQLDAIRDFRHWCRDHAASSTSPSEA